MFDDAWSSDDDDELTAATKPSASTSTGPVSSDLLSAERRILALEQKLANLQSSAADEITSLRSALLERSGVASAASELQADKGKGKANSTDAAEGDKKKVVINGPGMQKVEGEKGRDDDSHYFDSYAYNDM